MKRIFLSTMLCLSAVLLFSQTKEETIAYINNLLSLHNNGTIYHSVRHVSGNTLSADATVYMQGTNSMTLNYLFEAKDALYLNSTTNSNDVTLFVISFKPKGVKLMNANGSVMEYLDKIEMEGLLNMTSSEIEKIKKALKHFIKLFGGQIKDDPF